MNWFTVSSLLFTLSGIACQFSQNFGGGFDQGTQLFANDANSDSLAFNNQNALAKDAKLGAANRKKVQAAERKNLGARQNSGLRKGAQAKLAANNNLKAEEFGNSQNFQNVDVAASDNGASKTGFQFIDENQRNTKAAISAQDGTKKNTGARVFASENLGFQAADHFDAFDNFDFFDQNALQIAAADENELLAAENAKALDQTELNVASKAKQQASLQSDIFAGNSAFEGFGGFGGFGKRRR